MELHAVEVDLRKTLFRLHDADERGKVVLQMRVSRARVVETAAKLLACPIKMEACQGRASERAPSPLSDIRYDLSVRSLSPHTDAETTTSARTIVLMSECLNRALRSQLNSRLPGRAPHQHASGREQGQAPVAGILKGPENALSELIRRTHELLL